MASQFRQVLLHLIASFSVTPPKSHLRSSISIPLKNRILQRNPSNSTTSIFSYIHIPRTIFTGNVDSKIQLVISNKGISEHPDDRSHLGPSKNEVGSLQNECRTSVANTLFDKEGFAIVDELILKSVGKENKDLTTQRYGSPGLDDNYLIQQQHFLLNCTEVEKLVKTLRKPQNLETLKILEAYGFNMETLASLLDSCPSLLDSGYLNLWEPLFSRLEKYPNRTAIIQDVLKYSARFGLQPVGPENYEENVMFLCDHGIGSSYIGRCLEKCPLLFYLDRDTNLGPKIQVLRDAGAREETIGHVMRKYLNFITYRTDSLSLKIEYLKGIGLGREDINRVLVRLPGILAYSVEDRLKPIVAELQSLGYSGHSLVKIIVHDPCVLMMKVGGELSRCVSLLKNLKCRKSIQDKLLQDGVIKGSKRVKARVEFLTKHGLSHREAFKLLQKEPRIIIYDLQSIEQKVNFLINDMGFSARSLIEVPGYLGVKFDKQIVPRHKVIAYLRSRDGLGEEVSLKDLMKLTRIQFYKKYVRPYPDCEKIFGNCIKGGGKIGSQCKEKQP